MASERVLEVWIRRYFPQDQMPQALEILSGYGTESWHREQERVKRDAIIVSKGSLDALRAAVELAKTDYRDILVGEEIDPWVIGELRKYGA